MPQTSRRSIKTKKIICGQCKLEAKEDEEETIQCDKCLITYHALCTKLNKRQYKRLMENENEEFVCHVCDESGGDVQRELSEIKKQLTQLDKLNQLDAMQQSMTFMSQQFDDILKGIAENKKQLDAVVKENGVLKREVDELKKTVKYLNDNRVRNDCLFSGVEICGGAVESVIKLMESVDVTLSANEFEDAYVIGKNKNAAKTSIVAKFTTKSSKQKIMSAKSKLNQKEETKNVFINDFLGKETLELLNHAKSLKTVGYRRVYASNGKVFVKMGELSKPRVIHSADEVDKLLLESTRVRKSFQRTVRADISEESDEDAT